jgi:hypothetical protein
MGWLYLYRSCLYVRRLRACVVNRRECRLNAPSMHRTFQLLVMSGVMIAALTEIGPASAQSAMFRMPGCRSFLNQDNGLRYDFSSGVCSGIVEALMSTAAALGICCPPESTVNQGVRVIVQYVSSQPARLNESFEALAIEALRKAWPCTNP